MKKILVLVLSLCVFMSTIANASVSYEVEMSQDEIAEAYFKILHDREKVVAKSELSEEEKSITDKLNKEKMSVYKIGIDNKNKIEVDMGFSLKNLFGVKSEKEVDKIIGSNGLTIIVCDEEESLIVDTELNNESQTSRSAEIPDDYEFYFRKVYVSAAENGNYTATDYKDIYEEYANGFNPDSLYEILNRTFSLWIGHIPFVWYVPTIFGIDIEDVGACANEAYDIRFNGAWTRKFIMVATDFNGVYRTGAITEYCSWNQYDHLQYYSISKNRLLEKTTEKSGSVFADHYMDYDWLYEKAKIGYFFFDIQYDRTGNVSCKYDGDVVYSLSEPDIY